MKDYKNLTLYELAALNDFEYKVRLYKNLFLRNYWFDNTEISNIEGCETLSFHDLLIETPLSLDIKYHLNDKCVQEIIKKAQYIHNDIVVDKNLLEPCCDNDFYDYEPNDWKEFVISDDSNETKVNGPNKYFPFCFVNMFKTFFTMETRFVDNIGSEIAYSIKNSVFDRTVEFIKLSNGELLVQLLPNEKHLGVVLILSKRDACIYAVDEDNKYAFSKYFFRSSLNTLAIHALMDGEIVKEHLSEFHFNLGLPFIMDYHLGDYFNKRVVETPIERINTFENIFKSDYENVTTILEQKFDNQLVVSQIDNKFNRKNHELIIKDNNEEKTVSFFPSNNQGFIKYDFLTSTFTFKKNYRPDEYFKINFGLLKDLKGNEKALQVSIDFTDRNKKPFHIDLPLYPKKEETIKN